MKRREQPDILFLITSVINEADLKIIKRKLKKPLNLEIAATKEMLKIALKSKPPFVCIVPEKRKEITTEGGLDVKNNETYLKGYVNSLKSSNIEVSAFIDPVNDQINASGEIGFNFIASPTNFGVK